MFAVGSPKGAPLQRTPQAPGEGLTLVHDRSIQKLQGPRQVLGRVELIAAVPCAVDDVEVDVETQFLVGRVQLVESSPFLVETLRDS